MNDTPKLYKVNLRGMRYSSTGVVHGESYVVAANPDEAYKKVRAYLDHRDIGFTKDREMESIELIAECEPHTDLPHQLFI